MFPLLCGIIVAILKGDNETDYSMITKDEIEAKATEFGLHAANIERDYVFGWLLAGIYKTSPLKDLLVLKGGNCFRKAYFPHTRFSNDLDFSSTNAIDEPSLAAELNRICDFVQDQTGLSFEKDRNWVKEKANSDKDRRIYEARLYFKDFYGNPHTTTISVHLDVAEYDRIFLPIQERFLIHPYSDNAECNTTIRCHKLEELLAAKLKCLLQRRHSFDLYDYVYSVFINRDIEVNRAELLRTFLKKTIFEPSPGVAKGLLLDLPLETFRGIWQKYLVCQLQSLFDFDTALTRFKEDIESVFAGLRVDYYGQIAFYPSKFRNTIMQAASNLTLLDITYDGRRRLVEPYSLVFKRRKDGFGQEYFYAYDQTGGRTTGPSIKTFLHPKIQSLANTEQTFEPRLPIELGKAGEFATTGYFTTSFRTGSVRRARVRTTTSRVYIVECSYCGKRFPRKRYGARLRRHKDRYGNYCYGRSGYIAY
jgi:predicted nucleotidyltransferase component of viral defense system